MIIFIFFSPFCFSQDKKPESQLSKPQELKVTLDTLKVENINAESKKSDPLPWIVSLFIAGATIAINIYISNKSHKTSIQNVNAQIKASTQNSENQLAVNRDVVIKQIENSQDLAFAQFKATLNTKNRQDWINTLQHCVSEFLSQCFMINAVIHAHSNDSNKFMAIVFPYIEKMTYNRNKIAMLINPKNSNHIDLITPMDKILNTWATNLDEKSLNEFKNYQEKIIGSANIISRLSWEKIKDLSN